VRIFNGRRLRVSVLAWAIIHMSGCGSAPAPSSSGGFGMAPSGQASVASVALSTSSVTGGSSAQVTVTMAQAAPASGLSVALSSSDSSIASPSASLEIPAGQTSATLSFATSAVAAASAVTISASYNGSTAAANLSVLPPSTSSTGSYTVAVQPSTITVQQGKSGTSNVTTKALSGFDQSLALSVSKEPVGVTASLNPKTIAAPGSGTSKLTLNVGSSVQAGSYPLSVTATAGKTSQSATLTLKVTSGSGNPNATFKGCWYKSGGHRYQAVDVSVGNPGTYPFNAILYRGTTCDPNNFADQFGFGQLITFGGFGFTFWFTDFKDQTDMSALWYVGDQSSQCVNYTVAPGC
jgi:hypothetical protein